MGNLIGLVSIAVAIFFGLFLGIRVLCRDLLSKFSGMVGEQTKVFSDAVERQTKVFSDVVEVQTKVYCNELQRIFGNDMKGYFSGLASHLDDLPSTLDLFMSAQLWRDKKLGEDVTVSELDQARAMARKVKVYSDGLRKKK